MTTEQQNNANRGILTVGFSSVSGDPYDFAQRGILVRKTKEQFGLSEFDPLPSPWTVEIEPTVICNARCDFCSYKEMLANHREKIKNLGANNVANWLPKEKVFSVLEKLKEAGTTKGIFFSGGGESLLWPYIVEAARFASTFSEVSLQTNGINLDKFTNHPDDLAHLRLISVSVYGHNEKLHREVSGVNSFERVNENIIHVIKLRNEHHMNLTVNSKIMVTKSNFRSLPDIIDFYKNGIGVDVLGIRTVQNFNYGGNGPRKESVELDESELNELQNILSPYLNDPSVKGFSDHLSTRQLKPAAVSNCFNAIDGHFACIDPEGNVALGNPEIGIPKYNIGNINVQSWDEIWKSPRHYRVLNLMNRMQKTGNCDNYLCRHVRANFGTQQYLNGQLEPLPAKEVMENLGAFL